MDKTRPYIVVAVHKATRQTHGPRLHDCKLVKRITRYLKGTATLKVTMALAQDHKQAPRVEAFSDADFAADKTDRKFMNGSVLLLNGMSLR